MSYNLDRFHAAQRGDYARALAELRAGRKQTHWMWYIFPQLRMLGHSEMAQYYGIADLAEAQAYLADPVLRERLLTVTRVLLDLDCSDPLAVMGHPDHLKLCSSMTLFEAADPTQHEFGALLDRCFAGQRDNRTLAYLHRTPDNAGRGAHP